MSHGIEANWTSEDRFHLANLSVPVPPNEQKRVEILRKSKLLDVSTNDTGFSRFTSLASRLFNMQYSVVSFVEVERVVFKAKLGVDFSEISRNEWFDAYTVLPDSSEVYVVPDCLTDSRFKDKPYVKGHPKIRFYAGAAIMVDNLKIGVLSIMDTEPHKFFSLEDKENLLDLGAAAAQLAKEKLQTALNLSAERANIVVSMMHHLRTPMTSLNFATSLLCNDVHNIRTDYAAAATSTNTTSSNNNTMAVDEDRAQEESKDTANAPFQPPHSVFQSFESSFTEISNALNQLNILVDSSLSLGQAIIKCSTNEVASTSSANLQAMDPRSRFTECNIIDYLGDMFQNNLPVHNHNLEIEWIVDTLDLVRGTHVTFPDAVMLIVISTVSHMSTESNSLGFHFSFEQVDEDDMEYPELISKMLEGRLSIKVFAKDSRAYAGRVEPAAMEAMHAADEEGYNNNNNNNNNSSNSVATRSNTTNHGSSSSVASTPVHHHPDTNANPNNTNNNNTSNNNNSAPDVLSKQNFLSIDKILRAINGSSREFVDDVMLYSTVRPHNTSHSSNNNNNNNNSDNNDASNTPYQPEYRTIHEFLVPCKILLNSFNTNNNTNNTNNTNVADTASAGKPQQLPQQQPQQQHLRFFRPSSKHTASVTPKHHTDNNNNNNKGSNSSSNNNNNNYAGQSQSHKTTQQQQQQQVVLDTPHLNNNTVAGSGLAQHPHHTGISLPPPIHTGATNNVNTNTNTNASSMGSATNNNNNGSSSSSNTATTNNNAANNGGTVSSSSEGATSTTNATQPLRVLVVEDTIPVQKLLTRWLQNQGCQVTCASNGKIGLDQLTSQSFDIAFVDFLMPVMLGITTMKLFQQWLAEQQQQLQQQQQHQTNPDSPDSTTNNNNNNNNNGISAVVRNNRHVLIVGMSATALESEQEEAFNYGMHFFCPKPVSLELLTIILEAKRCHPLAQLEAAVDQVCDITGTAASDAVLATNNNNNNNNNDNDNNNSSSGGVNPKNKWTFFRSYKQSRLTGSNSSNNNNNDNDDNDN